MSESAAIRVSGMVPESIVDGLGLRFTLFVQGCPHHCEGCHNPQTHPFAGGQEFSPEEIFGKIAESPLCQGVTFSGGEPFSQAAALLPLARLIRERGLNLCCYSGYTFEQLCEMGKTQPAVLQLLGCCDVLVDGPFILAERTLEKRFAGSRNQRVLDVKASLKKGKAVLQDGWQ
ncbi:MAG: anaerobic ribonucleoside-triphosphate reductase activating protein [Provencibacterium sp.]|nr:anaerobic ribonucleoside-triphosphate reductase activating protein [Provencibacterium sp.]